MSYLINRMDCLIVRKTESLQKFLDTQGIAYYEEERDVSNSGVEEGEGVVEYRGVLYGEDCFTTNIHTITSQTE